jgi:hypothetical protein
VLRVFRSHLTYANVAATLALLFAMAGGAVAATHYLITSTRQISPKVLKELKGAAGAPGPAGSRGTNGANGTTGEKGERGEPGPEGKIGPIGVTGPQGNAGGPAAHWRKTIEKAGASKEAPETVTLETLGPFTIVGHCYVNGTSTVAATYIRTSEEGSVLAESEEGEQVELTTSKEALLSPEPAESETSEHEAAFKGPYGGLFSAESKTGAYALDGAVNEGVFLEGRAKPACYFSGYVVSE